MRLFLVCREAGCLRFVSVYAESLAGFAERYKAALEDRGHKVHVCLGSDLADVVRSHPSWFSDDDQGVPDHGADAFAAEDALRFHWGGTWCG